MITRNPHPKASAKVVGDRHAIPYEDFHALSGPAVRATAATHAPKGC
ncbi:hypothetical protein [Streptomyces sp. NPDC048357]